MLRKLYAGPDACRLPAHARVSFCEVSNNVALMRHERRSQMKELGAMMRTRVANIQSSKWGALKTAFLLSVDSFVGRLTSPSSRCMAKRAREQEQDAVHLSHASASKRRAVEPLPEGLHDFAEAAVLPHHRQPEAAAPVTDPDWGEGLPEGWLQCPPMGKQLGDYIPMKVAHQLPWATTEQAVHMGSGVWPVQVPLGVQYNDRIPPDKRFTPRHVVEKLALQGVQVCCVTSRLPTGSPGHVGH